VLKRIHYRLLEVEEAAEGDKPSASHLEAVRNFMLRASATGRIIEDFDEREIAQTLLNYWATVLMRRARRTPFHALLWPNSTKMSFAISMKASVLIMVSKRIRKQPRISSSGARRRSPHGPSSPEKAPTRGIRSKRFREDFADQGWTASSLQSRDRFGRTLDGRRASAAGR
jgi:hypothetical protein